MSPRIRYALGVCRDAVLALGVCWVAAWLIVTGVSR